MGNTIPNKVDGTLKFETEIAQASEDKVGKHPIIAKDVTTIDVPSSEVVKDWEDRNDKAVTQRRSDPKVTFDIAVDADLLGKVVGDLQKDIAESAGTITGTLKYVEGYTGFSSDPEMQQGNFLAFKVGYSGEFTNITAKKGDLEEKDYDPSDSTFIYFMDKHYPITVKVYNGDTAVASKKFDTTQLAFEPAENS